MISLNEFLVKKHITTSSYEAIDMGLPSGTKWANCNVGATKPEDPGLLFQWAKTTGYRFNDKNHNFLGTEEYIDKSKYKGEYMYLKPKDDAATNNMGKEWKIPHSKDFTELVN